MSTHTTARRLTRNTEEGMLGGVCAGLADHLGLDVTLVRILAVLGAIFGFGSWSSPTSSPGC